MAKDFYAVTGTTIVPESAPTANAVLIPAGSKSGTATQGDLQVGDWIVNSLEARRVIGVTFITGGISFSLARPFTLAISGVVEVVSKKAASVVYMEIEADGAITIDGVAIAAGTKSFGNQNNSGDETKFARPRTVVGAAIISLEYINNQMVD